MKSGILTHLINPAFHLVVFVSITVAGYPQDTNRVISPISSDIPQVIWVNQWPSRDQKQKDHTFRERFNSIFLGKKTAVLSRPVSVLAYNPENLWILDQGACSVFHAEGKLGDIPHFLKKADLDFSSLVGICATPHSGILFTDSHAKKIYRILPEKKKVQILHDSLFLDQPTGIAWSPVTGEIWVVETNAHCITVLDANGNIVKKIGSRGTGSRQFNYPTHIWIDKAGQVYIVDAMNFRVQVLNPAGEVISVFGKPGDASGYFARPKGIAADSHGNIYVVDALFHVVQVFNLNGDFLYRLGNQGQGEGEFWMPSGIFIDERDFIYVSDSYNSRIQVFQLVYQNQK
jgi:sugar lactone lactonase YvrE